MKTLYVIRHAKSSWEDPFIDDFDRPLNHRGLRDAPRMGQRLRKSRVSIDRFLSSPARRAVSTAAILAEAMGVEPSSIITERRLYHATDEVLISVVRDVEDSVRSLALFGHNPGLTDFVNRLARTGVTENIPTCGVVTLSLPVTSWRDTAWETAELLSFDYPKKK